MSTRIVLGGISLLGAVILCLAYLSLEGRDAEEPLPRTLTPAPRLDLESAEAPLVPQDVQEPSRSEAPQPAAAEIPRDDPRAEIDRIVRDAEYMFSSFASLDELADPDLCSTLRLRMAIVVERNGLTCARIDEVLAALPDDHPSRLWFLLAYGWAGGFTDRHAALLADQAATVFRDDDPAALAAAAALQALRFTASEEAIDRVLQSVVSCTAWSEQRRALAVLALTSRGLEGGELPDRILSLAASAAPEDVRRAAWAALGATAGMAGFSSAVAAVRSGDRTALDGLEHVRDPRLAGELRSLLSSDDGEIVKAACAGFLSIASDETIGVMERMLSAAAGGDENLALDVGPIGCMPTGEELLAVFDKAHNPVLIAKVLGLLHKYTPDQNRPRSQLFRTATFNAIGSIGPHVNGMRLPPATSRAARESLRTLIENLPPDTEAHHKAIDYLVRFGTAEDIPFLDRYCDVRERWAGFRNDFDELSTK